MSNSQKSPISWIDHAIATKNLRRETVANLAQKINALSEALPLSGDFEDAGFQMADLASAAAAIIMKDGAVSRGAFRVDPEIFDFFIATLSPSTQERMELTPEHIPELFQDFFLLQKARREGALIEEAMQPQQTVDGQADPAVSKPTPRL